MAKVELDLRAKIVNLQRGLNKTERQLKDLQVQSTKTSKTMQSNMRRTGAGVENLTAKIGALLTIGAAVQFTKAIIAVRSEFEKYDAVLTNTLGSARAANREFAKIQEFAANTPFSVRELTDSFVRLVNQGFKPTTTEMRKLGDIAASTGKEFIQLTEAIIDAQTGEFERLKEFGIRASKQGDQVTFTFKEIQTQVEFTASAIQEYILSLGELEGVSGAMEAISLTLGGQINNLADSWDRLLDSLGERTSGVFSTVINILNFALTTFAKYGELQEGVTESSKEFVTAFTEGLETLSEEDKIAAATEEMNHFNEQFMLLNDNTQLYSQVYSKEEIKQMEALATTYNAIKIALSEYIAEQEELIANRDPEEEEIENIEALQKKLKGLIDDKKKLSITDTERLGKINRETAALKAQIKELETLGVATEKLKDLKLAELDIDDGFDEQLKDQAKEQLEFEKDIDKQILDSTKARVDAELAEEMRLAEQKMLLTEGVGAIAIEGLQLIANANKENAELQQATAIAQAIINGALGITKTGAQLGYPAAIPFQIALGLQTLAQIATIRSQKFERGGYDVLKGRRHAQGGVDIGIGEAEEGEGIGVFSRQATRKYGKFLPAFVKAINENEATVTGYGDNAYNIHFDDSQSVSELKVISKLLDKPDIIHEGGYRIEIRKGHRTKVKI